MRKTSQLYELAMNIIVITVYGQLDFSMGDFGWLGMTMGDYGQLDISMGDYG